MDDASASHETSGQEMPPVPRELLFLGGVALLCLAMIVVAGGVAVVMLLTEGTSPAANPTPPLRALSGPTATPLPPASPTPHQAPTEPVATMAPGDIGTLPGGAPAADDSPYYYELYDWPGPPTVWQSITLPPPATDEQQLAEADRQYRQGKAAFDLEQWQEAIPLFDQALELNPRHAEAYNFRGAAIRHLDSQGALDLYLTHHELAIADFTRAIAADPTWWRPLNNRGLSYLYRANEEPLRSAREQWWDLALADYTRALELDETQTGPRWNRAALYMVMGQGELAMEDTKLCAVENPELCILKNPEGCMSQALRSVGDYEQALSVIGPALRADSGDSSMWLEEAEVFMGLGDYKNALMDYQHVETMLGDSVPGVVLYRQAAAYYYLGDYDKVVERIERGRPRTWMDWGAPYYYLGMVYLKQGDVENAILALEWAEQTLDADDPLLPLTREELERLVPEGHPAALVHSGSRRSSALRLRPPRPGSVPGASPTRA